jgi:hypothetical protein
LESNLKAVKLASEWTKENEDKMKAILNNDPDQRINWQKFQPFKQRREMSVNYNLELGKVEPKRNHLTAKIE